MGRGKGKKRSEGKERQGKRETRVEGEKSGLKKKIGGMGGRKERKVIGKKKIQGKERRKRV